MIKRIYPRRLFPRRSPQTALRGYPSGIYTPKKIYRLIHNENIIQLLKPEGFYYTVWTGDVWERLLKGK